MGRTAGLSQNAGVWTGCGLVAAGRSVGRLLRTSSKLRFGAERRAAHHEPGGGRDQAGEAAPEPSLQPGAFQSEQESRLLDMKDAKAEAQAARTRAAAVEADLALLRGELEEARRQAEDARAKFSSQVGALQSDKESLLSDLKDAEGAGARADSLEADVGLATRELEELRHQVGKGQAKYSTQVSALDSDKESLLSDLRDAQARADDAVSRADDLDAELSKLREALKSAASENEELRSAGQREQSLQRAEAADEDFIWGAGGPSSEEPAVESAGLTGVAVESEESGRQATEEGISAAPIVIAEEARAAVFSGAAERLVFTRAVSNLASDNVATRVAAAKALGAIRHQLSVRSLIAGFRRETSPEVRQECLCALTGLEAAEAIPVAEGALQDEAASVRLAAVRAVYRLAGLEGVDVLARMLNDKDEDVRRRTATCLGWLGHEPLAFKLVSLLRDTSASVRLAALEALGNLKSPAVVDEVMELLDDPEESVQRATCQTLETITGKQMAETFPEDKEGRKFLIARWRAWREKDPSHLQKAALVTASG